MSKTKLFTHIEEALLSGDVSAGCKRAAELLELGGRCKGELISWIVDRYSGFYLSRNLWVLESLCNNLDVMINVSRIKNVQFQKTVCELLCLLCALKSRPKKYGWNGACVIGVDSIESLLFTYVSVPSMTKYFGHLTSEEVCKYLGILVHCVKAHERADVCKMLDFLLFADKSSGVQVSAEIAYDEIKDIPESLRPDIVWYLWRSLLLLCGKNKNVPEYKAWIKLQLSLFMTGFNSRTRLTRLNILYFCFITVTENRDITKKVKNLQTVNYADFFKQPEQNTISKQRPRVITVDENNESVTKDIPKKQIQSKSKGKGKSKTTIQNEPDMSYLKFVTYCSTNP